MATKQVNTTTTTEESPSFIQKILGNSKLLIGLGVLILLVGGVVLFLRNNAKEANEKAKIELARIRGYYDKGDFNLAIAGDSSKLFNKQKVRGLKALVADYDGTPTGTLAALYLGNSYMALGKADNAAESYSKAVGSSEPTIEAAAHAGLASVAEAKGKFEEAAKEFENAAELDKMEVNTPDYLLNAARNYERANKKDEAVKLYRRVATEFVESQANAGARLALARFNVEI